MSEMKPTSACYNQIEAIKGIIKGTIAANTGMGRRLTTSESRKIDFEVHAALWEIMSALNVLPKDDTAMLSCKPAVLQQMENNYKLMKGDSPKDDPSNPGD